MPFTLPDAPDRAGLRHFGLVTGSVFAVLFGLVFAWIFDAGWPVWPWIVGAVFVGLALVAPAALGPVYRIWMGIAHVLGAINAKVLLTVIFYLVFTPVGLVRRLAGKDSMDRRFMSGETSYRKTSEDRDTAHVERPF